MLNFNENQVTITIFIPITQIFILFMPNWYSICLLAAFFLHFSSFNTSWIRIRIPNADPSGFGTETLCRGSNIQTI
jgi:hypothetical protein